jgi:hypothetical protein
MLERQTVGPSTVAFVCIAWGDKYGPEYVSRLVAAVRAHCTLAAPFFCLTDRVEQLRAYGAPVDCVPTPCDWHGWWQKLLLFRRDWFGRRHVVFFDLDMVVAGSLDGLLAEIGRYELVYAQDLIDRMSSSLMIIDTHSALARDVVDGFDPVRWVKPEDIDQDYLRQFIDGRYRLKGLDPRQHYSYKYLIDRDDWVARTTNPTYRPASFDEIVTFNFHGYPKPADIAAAPQAWPYGERLAAYWQREPVSASDSPS